MAARGQTWSVSSCWTPVTHIVGYKNSISIPQICAQQHYQAEHVWNWTVPASLGAYKKEISTIIHIYWIEWGTAHLPFPIPSDDIGHLDREPEWLSRASPRINLPSGMARLWGHAAMKISVSLAESSHPLMIYVIHTVRLCSCFAGIAWPHCAWWDLYTERAQLAHWLWPCDMNHTSLFLFQSSD